MNKTRETYIIFNNLVSDISKQYAKECLDVWINIIIKRNKINNKDKLTKYLIDKMPSLTKDKQQIIDEQNILHKQQIVDEQNIVHKQQIVDEQQHTLDKLDTPIHFEFPKISDISYFNIKFERILFILCLI